MHDVTAAQHPMQLPEWRQLWPALLPEFESFCRFGAEEYWAALARMMPECHIAGHIVDEEGISFGIIFEIPTDSRFGLVYPRFAFDEQSSTGYRVKAPAEAFFSGNRVSLDAIEQILAALIGGHTGRVLSGDPKWQKWLFHP